MGDTGALLLGYSIAVVSMLGLFKNVALFSFAIPIIVIAVPFLIRRLRSYGGRLIGRGLQQLIKAYPLSVNEDGVQSPDSGFDYLWIQCFLRWYGHCI